MDCFHHSGTPAVGICKHCHKGVCSECATDTGAGLACPGSCVEVVHDLNRLIKRNVSSAGTHAWTAYFTPAFLLTIGVILIGFGLGGGSNSRFPLVMGTGLLAFGLLSAYRVYRWVTSA